MNVHSSRRRTYGADERCQGHGAGAAASVQSAEQPPGFDRSHFPFT